jgi:hypothetical protein
MTVFDVTSLSAVEILLEIAAATPGLRYGMPGR